MIDRDILIDRLKGISVSDMNNFLEILLKIELSGYIKEYLEILYRIVDEGFIIRVIAGEYEYDKVKNFGKIKEYDNSSVEILETVGNDMFSYMFSTNCFKLGNRYKEMLTKIVDILIDTRYYMIVENSDYSFLNKPVS